MILSRIIEHVKQQHWTAIFIDFLIVVIGVFIANQVTTWKEEAGLSKRKAAAIERLHAEGEAVIDYVAGRVQMFAEQNAMREEAMQRLVDDDWTGADTRKMSEAFESIDLAPAAAPPRSVYDELISTGLFAEIGDAKLRDAVADYYAYLLFLQGQIDYVRQGFAAGPEPRDFKGITLSYDRKAFRGQRTTFDFQALSADPQFVGYAITRNADQVAQQQWWTLTLLKAKAMCAEIARYDGRPCQPKSTGQGKEIFGTTDAPGS
ncbi:MAG: hypothetical protein FIB04_00600 [Gammaproteobacteria bacterium]|nr:hypothetical protein [Gammaproteobacteria bacterium]